MQNGKIVRYGRFNDINAQGTLVDFGDKIVIPGMIDTHVHLPQYDMVAMDGYELLDWLSHYIFPAEKRFESPKVAQEAARRFFEDMQANGTTTACIYNTVHKDATERAFEEAERSGLRVFMGKVMMDQNCPDFLREKTSESLETSELLCKAWHGKDGGRLNYVFTPRFAPTCSRELMKGASKLAKKHSAYIQTHLSENRGELNLVKTLFPESKNYTDVYEKAGLLTPRTIMAHCIYLDEPELLILKNYSTKISHCPSSNFFLKSGIFDIGKTTAAGLDVGLGSDVGGGPNLSLFREMANASNMSKVNYILSRGNSKVIDPTFAFYLATLGGAKVLGIENVVGNFSPGKEADFVVVDGAAIDPLRSNRKRTGNEILSQMIHRASEETVIATYVRGTRVYQK